MNLPNKLTVARMCLIPVFLVVLLGNIFGAPTSGYVAVAIFVIASFTDFLDGYIARSQNLITNFGKFMDPLADKLLVSAALISMVQLGSLPAWVTIVIISRELLITAFRTIAASNNIVLAAGAGGKLKTVTQMVMIVFVLLNFQWSWVPLVSNILIFLAVLFTVVSAVDYVVKNANVLKEQN